MRRRRYRRLSTTQSLMPPPWAKQILVGVESLFGLPEPGALDRPSFELGEREIIEDIGYEDGDVLHNAVSHRNPTHAAIVPSSRRMHLRSGIHGANFELVAPANADLMHPDRISEVVVGPDDGHFVDTVVKCTSMDIPVSVIANPRGIHEIRRDFEAWRYRV